MRIHTPALKHGVSVEDIEHAVRNAMVIEDDLCLYLGPSGSAEMLEVITILLDEDPDELTIHAMPMRGKYRDLLPEGDE